MTLGDLTKPVPVLMLLGFVLIAGLNYRRVLGGTLIGTLIVTTIGLPFGLAQFNGVVSVPPSLARHFCNSIFLASVNSHS